MVWLGTGVIPSHLHRITPRAESANKQVTTKYLAYRLHLRYVVYMGGYSNSLSQR
jgi:hypothetical protein